MRRLIMRTMVEFVSPMRIGSSKDDLSDSPILRDEQDQPFIPGTTWAGILRSAAHELENAKSHFANKWFGFVDNENLDEGSSSKIITRDSKVVLDDPEFVIPIHVRDGVSIDLDKGTALDSKKFDYEVLPVGVKFAFELEVLMDEIDSDEDIILFARLLNEFHGGHLRIGSKTSRGFGKFKVSGQWQVWDFNFHDNPLITYRHWLQWNLDESRIKPQDFNTPEELVDALFSIKPEQLNQPSGLRDEFYIKANVRVAGSLIVRTASLDTQADHIQLKQSFLNAQGNAELPVLPGTSIAGVVRAQASRIVNTVHGELGQGIINKLFGHSEKKDKHASRVWVDDCCLKNGESMLHTRVRIDRFTGGAMDNFLFTEAPTYLGHGVMKLGIRLKELDERDRNVGIGLMLLVFKDLWLGDLRFGGESSIGRGRLNVVDATVTITMNGSTTSWTFSRQSFSSEGPIKNPETFELSGSPESLEYYVNQFVKEIVG